MILYVSVLISLLLTACAADPEQASPAATEEQATSTSPSAAATFPTQTETPQPADSPGKDQTSPPQANDLNLQFANVTAVEFRQLSGGDYRFDVTLYHDDDGEAPQFADARQELDLEGRVLGERELLHSHGTQPFTRSETINIPEGIQVVLIRGHDMNHGYGGQGMQVDLETGETTPVQIEAGK